MVYNPELHHRRSIRLQGYDYAITGAYFVTICTQGRECLFGEVVSGVMIPTPAGEMMTQVWQELPQHYPGVEIDVHVVMPDHFHGIIHLTTPPVGADPRGRPDLCHGPGHPQGGAPTSLSLGDVVHRFKSMTTHAYATGVKQHGWTPFPGRIWQSNYHERIVRDEAERTALCEYMVDNPARFAPITNP
ncbi:MAG: transposase [Desulfuromonadales bacterium]|nr:transposase [Desulfuromonadales bacterium]